MDGMSGTESVKYRGQWIWMGLYRVQQTWSQLNLNLPIGRKCRHRKNLYRCAIPFLLYQCCHHGPPPLLRPSQSILGAIVDVFIVWWFYPPTVYVNRWLCPFKHHLQCQPMTPWAVSLEGVTHWKQINTFGGPSQKNPQSFYQNPHETLNPHDHDPPMTRPTPPLPALYENLQAPLTAYLPRQKKTSCRYL